MAAMILAMLSAADCPIVLYGSLQLPPIIPHDPVLHALLRQVHTYAAYLLFVTVLVHLGAGLMHARIERDGVFDSMAPWKTRVREG
jgi:cytochrome b561